MSNRTQLLGLFLATAGLAGSASATTAVTPDSTEPRPQSATVRYHEAELATSQGADRLFRILDRAAHDVCDDTGEYVVAHSFSACERSAIADAVAQVDNTQLTAIYDQHFPNYPLIAATSLRLIPAIIVIVG